MSEFEFYNIAFALLVSQQIDFNIFVITVFSFFVLINYKMQTRGTSQKF